MKNLLTVFLIYSTHAGLAPAVLAQDAAPADRNPVNTTAAPVGMQRSHSANPRRAA